MRSELLFDASCSITARASAAAKRAQRAERVGWMRLLCRHSFDTSGTSALFFHSNFSCDIVGRLRKRHIFLQPFVGATESKFTVLVLN